MWVCQQIGITPCVYLSKFNNLADFCVQVLIVPRVLYHQEEEMYHFLEETILLRKREVMTGPEVPGFNMKSTTGLIRIRHRFPDPLYYYPPQILHIDSVILLLMIPIGILQRPLGVC
ncbi:hypothetical protein DUI87_26458 [Hirundo rustica rustica]|uniref:Uncharacterized protein n=1 Tax=Hirundo rustica rustica TaxID=333673 RepID=A0A3M0J6N7_HIRRU|nr:hypothetical protein DUI87_26458 [Hirundo rustica rustica]